MSDSLEYTSVEEENVRFAEDFPVLDIPIYPAGDDAGLHIQNDPDDPWERETIIQRKGRVNIRCEHKAVAHGYYSDECDDLYSLIVIQFRFDPNGIAARIKEAHVTIKFAAGKPGERDPVVKRMYPEGMFTVEPTQQHEQVVRGGTLQLKVGGGGMAEMGGELKTEKTTDRDKTDFTLVRGSSDVLRSYGPKNAVSWDFLENVTTKTGVVCSLRGAILLKRDSMKPFKATVTLKATADTYSTISTIFQKDPKDDDLWYHPEKEPTESLREYVDNLGTVNLSTFCDVTFRTLLKNTVKELTVGAE